MPRPRTVDTNGNTHRLTVVISQCDLNKLRKIAQSRNVTVGAVVREKLRFADEF